MWCRAALTITLLACTFQRTNGQSHDTKDLLCVLILSGLQKEDLDVALLRKLQRHNVNIDDLDNADIRNECKLENANNSDNDTKNDVQKSMRRHNEANKNTSEKVEDQIIEVNSTKEEENITKLIKLFSNITPEVKLISSITPELNLQRVKEDTTTTKIAKPVKTHTKPEPNSITYINKVLQQFIAQVATSPPTTTPATTVDLKSILYEIKDMLANKNVDGRKALTENRNGRQEYNSNEDSLKIKVYTKAVNDRMMNKKKDMKRQKENVELVDRSQEVSNERPIKDDTKSLSPNKTLTKKETTKNESLKIDINMIPGNIIKDIAESIKALVLQDLKKEMSTSTTKSTTSKTDTETTTIASTKQENDLAQFMQLFQQFKNNIIPVVNKNITGAIQHEIISNDKVPPTLTTMPNNPYPNPIISHVIHNIQVPNVLTNLNKELQALPIYRTNSINRINQVNIFNPKHDIHPITIQTNIGEIPPLKIPMIAPPIKMIYQNIVVTTENSFEYFKNIPRLKSTSNINPNNIGDNRKLNPKHHDYLKLDHSKHHHEVEGIKSLSNHNKGKQEHGKMRSQNRNFERFHEKLERTDRDDWQQYSNEHESTEKMKVAKRPLKPLNDNKPKFDDTHFRNFLKTQQKVNDMLERILATKTIAKSRSVEIP